MITVDGNDALPPGTYAPMLRSGRDENSVARPVALVVLACPGYVDAHETQHTLARQFETCGDVAWNEQPRASCERRQSHAQALEP